MINRREFVGGATASAALMPAAGFANARRGPVATVNGAVFNRAPLSNQPFAPLPLGAVHAKGWLATQLETMAQGLTGRLDEFYSLVGPQNAWLGGNGDAWERGPYWLDGLVPLAHILDDERLKDKAQPWIEFALRSQQASGYFGPPDDRGSGTDENGIQRANSADWWPRMVMLKVLQQHHEATGDRRVLDFMSRYFAYQRRQLPTQPLDHWTKWARHRGGENTASALWLYNRTGEPSLLELARTLVSQTSDWTAGFAAEQPPTAHGVNVAMGVKQPALAYLLDGRPGHIEAIRHGLMFLERDHGQVTGMFSGDEPLHGTNPIQGTELCTVVEFMFSLEMLGQITGDVTVLDRLERIAYNALPAQTTDDYMARQYFQQPNQVMISRDVEQYAQQHGGTSQLVGLLDGYPCCTVNMHQGWPKFVHSMWAASADGGLAVLSYGPSSARATIGGIEVEAEQQTSYPFSDEVRIVLRTERPTSFPLHLRIPGWAEGATLKVNGQHEALASSGQITRLERLWRTGDAVELIFPAKIARSAWHKQLTSLERGPLVFALPIGEEWRKIGERGGIDTSEIFPTTPWNYALEPDADVTLARTETVSDRPWIGANAPLSLSTAGRKIPGWDRYHQTHGSLPFSPVSTDAPAETLRLIPYGCTLLRMSEFPIAKV